MELAEWLLVIIEKFKSFYQSQEKKKEEVVFIDNLTDEQNKTLHNINTTFCLLKISTK